MTDNKNQLVLATDNLMNTETFRLHRLSRDRFIQELRDACKEADISAPNPISINFENDIGSIDIDKEIIDKLSPTRLSELRSYRA